MKKKTKKKTELVEVSFRELLARKLASFKVETGAHSDGGASWITLQKDNIIIEFLFDGEGGFIKDVALYEQVVQVVDQKKILSFKQ